MAQLIARAVWDREVEGLSPFTPTTEKRPSLDGRFSVALECPQTFDFFAPAKNSRRFGVASEAWKSTKYFSM